MRLLDARREQKPYQKPLLENCRWPDIAEVPQLALMDASSRSILRVQISSLAKPVWNIRYLCETRVTARQQVKPALRPLNKFPSTPNIMLADRKPKLRQFRPMADTSRSQLGDQ